MHSLRFVSLTGLFKAPLLPAHVTFYLHFYVTSRYENQVLVDHQSAPLKVFHNVNL